MSNPTPSSTLAARSGRSRRVASLSAAVLLLGLGAPACGPSDPAAEPATESVAAASPTAGSAASERLVLITVDTLRADRFDGSAGVMDGLAAVAAERGLVFTRAFAATPVTQPTHASLLTGSHPWEHGVTRNGQRLDDGATTLAERLTEAGWTTAAVVSSFPLERRFGWDQGFASFEDRFSEGRDAKLQTWEGVEPDFERFYSLSDEVVGRALDVLDALDGARQFLWVHLYDPHSPYGDSLRGARPEITTKELGWLLQSDRAKGEQLLKIVARRYDDDVRAVDRAIARLLARLDADGVPTHVVVTADHGESLADDGSLGHGDRVTPQQVQVPLVILSPRVERPARRDDVAGSVDVHATLLDLAGLPPAGSGRSLLGPGRDDALAVGMRRTYLEPTSEVRADGSVVLLEGQRFFLARGGELLAGDARTVAGSADEELVDRARAAFAAFGQALQAGGAVDLDDAGTRAALEALGYTR